MFVAVQFYKSVEPRNLEIEAQFPRSSPVYLAVYDFAVLKNMHNALDSASEKI